MAAIKSAPWDDWWDNLASQGHWTLPASQAQRINQAEIPAAAPVDLPRLTSSFSPPERVSVPWREIEDLHTAVSQLDGEKQRLAQNLELAQKSLEKSTELRASLEFLEAENLSLRQRLMLLEREGR